MATAITKYVNTSATGSGDGSSYANGYTSMAAAITALAKDLVSADETLTIYYKADSTADTTWNLTGFTVDATRYVSIIVESAYRHSGIWSDSKTRVEYSGGTAVTISNNYTVLEGLQIKQTWGGGYAEYHGLLISATGCTIRKNIVKRSGTTVGNGIRLASGSSSARHKVYNNIVYDFGSAVNFSCYGGNDSACVYFNTAYGGSTNFGTGYENTRFKNNVAMGSTPDYSGAMLGAVKNGYTSWTSPPADQINITQSISDVFENYSSRNFKVKNTSSQIYHVGADLSSDTYCPVTDDIIGTTRYSTPSIGAFEYVATATGNPHYYYRQQ